MARKKKKKNNNIHITALSRAALVMVLAAALAAGVISLLACFYSIIFLPCAIVCFWLTYICVKEWQRRKAELHKTVETKGEA